MMKRPNWLSTTLFFCAVQFLTGPAFAYLAPGDTPAPIGKFVASSPLLAIALAGERLVAVGQRGTVVYSDDEGQHWKQAQVPVSNDLVALSFPSAQQGWATGHGGVVLHTADGGVTWTKQLDGQRSAELTDAYYADRIAHAANAEVERAAQQAKLLVDKQYTQSLLDIHFESDTSGFVVGTFNRLFHTADGGLTWTPWMDRTDNLQELHFYSVGNEGHGTYLTGESGLVWKLNPAGDHFDAIQTPYNGTLFGLFAQGDELFVYGMRGSLLRREQDGSAWEKLNTGTNAGVSGGVVLPGGRIAIVTQAGEILVSADRGDTFTRLKATKRMPYYGVAVTASGKLAVVGANGASIETIP